MRLDMHSRRQIVEASYGEYQRAGRKEKAAILDRLVPTSGMNRDYLAHVLSSYGKSQTVELDGKPVRLVAKVPRKKRGEGKRGGRPRKYDEAFVAVLADIWGHNEYQCGKLLSPFIRGAIDFLAASKASVATLDYGITDEIRAKLLTVSPAEIDILLRPERKKLEIKGRSLTKAGPLLRDMVPVRTFFSWDERKPGFFELDRVAHCGLSNSGEFCWTLTVTDVATGWTEERALLNNAHRWTKEGISNIKSELPFPLYGIDSDNGGEFINKQLVDWCVENHITQTRGRPYRKNDNCFVEQKNGDVVRKTVGYFRFDTPAEHKALAEVYQCLCPLLNYWYPSIKIIGKIKLENGRYKKIYDKPKTPCERLLESPDVSEENKAELRRRRELYNPVVMKHALDIVRDRLLQLNREKVSMN
jgi:hypothetical protein